VAQDGEGQVRWRTWHAYPQEGRLVVTRTRVGIPSHGVQQGRTGAGPAVRAVVDSCG
jgi:hypothetical protein